MPVDKKSDHYTSAQNYKDLDGNIKSFTFVDHDVKTKIGTTKKMTDEERKELEESVIRGRVRSIDQILSLPAVSFLRSGNTFADFYVLRDEEKGIIWDEKLLREALMINYEMIYVIYNTVWKHTVAEKNWFTEMSHEDILAGKWKELI